VSIKLARPASGGPNSRSILRSGVASEELSLAPAPEVIIKRKESARTTRDPDRTRSAILAAAITLLAREGRDALNVSRVAKLARISRGTAYLHFRSREELTLAALEAVSLRLCEVAFIPAGQLARMSVADSLSRTHRLAQFAMQNQALGQVWLNYILTSDGLASDPFWVRWNALTQALVASPLARPDVDAEVLAVILLSSYFIWPVWAGKQASLRGSSRRTLADRLANEVSRLLLAGVLRPDLAEAKATRAWSNAAGSPMAESHAPSKS
jgi:AcrR family transcriptional regulator